MFGFERIHPDDRPWTAEVFERAKRKRADFELKLPNRSSGLKGHQRPARKHYGDGSQRNDDWDTKGMNENAT